MTPRRLSGCAMLALVTLAAAPGAALPRGRDCRPLQALTAVDGKAFADLRLQLLPGTGVALRSGNARASLAPAATCELEADSYGGTVSCHWEFEGFTEATASYERLLAELRRCTEAALPQEQGRSSETINVLRRNSSAIPVGRAASEIETELLEFGSGGYWVKIEVEHDPEGAADLVDDEQDGD